MLPARPSLDDADAATSLPGPRGSLHTKGLLPREQGALIIQRQGGGRWRLEADPGAEMMVGRRVLIDGSRSGFDVLEVSSATLC